MNKYLNKIFTIIDYILVFLFTIIIIFVTYTYYIKNIKGSSYVDYLGYTYLEVISGSMSDTINIHDMVILDTKNYYINVGDIITYKSGNELITHRVIKISNDTLTTKGDANADEDSTIKYNDVIGKVIKIVPEFGILRKTLLTPKVIISIISTIILFNIYLFFNEESVNKRKKKKFERTMETQQIDISLLKEMVKKYGQEKK